MRSIELDVLIFGGGIAGLWLLDALHRRGHQCILLERTALGAGQTIASQGILHGGLKYSLGGVLDPSSKAVADMPARWRASLQGTTQPDLRAAGVLSPCCYLWRTGSLASRAGMMAAQVVIRTPLEKVPTEQRPRPLMQCPGDVFRIEEEVIDTLSLLESFRVAHAARVFLFDQVRFEQKASKLQALVGFGRNHDELAIETATAVFTAGEGNASLRALAGLAPDAMQTRPLHMVMVRGNLPALHGHCIDGNRTRVTITTTANCENKTVWLVGGEAAERGVEFDPTELVLFAREELRQVLPAIDFTGTQWSTYRVNRAEGKCPGNRRPEGVVWRREGAFITAWPTKLVLAPRLAEEIAAALPPPGNHRPPLCLPELPRPSIASPPWEQQEWI